jgi:Sec-independent protein translocase protein TatA
MVKTAYICIGVTIIVLIAVILTVVFTREKFRNVLKPSSKKERFNGWNKKDKLVKKADKESCNSNTSCS